jgi:hypothetical protein
LARAFCAAASFLNRAIAGVCFQADRFSDRAEAARLSER